MLHLNKSITKGGINIKKLEKGFTIIELLVVITIIGILSAALFPSVLGYMRDARISTANSAAKIVHTAGQSWLTQSITADIVDGADFVGVSLNDADRTAISYDTTSNASAAVPTGMINQATPIPVDISKYLGSDYDDGFWAFRIDEIHGESIVWAVWSANSPPICWPTKAYQDNLSNDIIGGFPNNATGVDVNV